MIVCADDYGLADDIDAAILDLVAARRLSAVSCLVLLERCSPACLANLLAHQATLDLGLHLCLTDEQLPLSITAGMASGWQPSPSFGSLVRQTLSRSLRPAEAGAAISSQYDLFLQKFGRSPDFIDGHLHVHQLPVIRDALVRFVLSLPFDSRPYVRNTYLPVRELRRRSLPWGKATAIGAFGRRMLSLLRPAGIRTNSGFSGIYNFSDWSRYPELLPRFLDCLGHPNGMLVVHPGTREDWRHQETAALMQFQFTRGSPARFERAVK
jgi:chitin disaccharide deacetylase